MKPSPNDTSIKAFALIMIKNKSGRIFNFREGCDGEDKNNFFAISKVNMNSWKL